jgi:predicted nucleic acid-binding protein
MRGQRVYVDTNIFIYFLERNANFFPMVAPILQSMSKQDFSGFTGEIAVAETMVGPYRTKNPVAISNTRDFFKTSSFLTILPHDSAIFDHAAQLRASQKMRFIDAVHIATAIAAACTFFITNDTALRTIGGLGVVQLKTLQP